MLKLIAVFSIILSHSFPSGLNITESTRSIQQLIFVFMKYGGQIGNDIFIVSSAWFLLESNLCKVEKVVRIVVDSLVVSVLSLLIYCSFFGGVTLLEIIKAFIPITMNKNWFVGCYIIFYLIHPFLNIVIRTITQRELLKINMALILFYCIIQTAFRDRYYYTPMVGFICIYFFVAYVKLYMLQFTESKNANFIVLGVSTSLLFLSVVCLNGMGLKVGFLSHYLTTWSVVTNPMIIAISISLFNRFNLKVVSNCVIDYISGLSLLIYIIHTSFLDYGFKKWFFLIFEGTEIYKYQVLISIIMVIMLSLISFLIAAIYKETLQKALYRHSDSSTRKICFLINQFVEKIT